MSDDLKKEALEHLEEIFHDERFAKSGEELLKELIRDYSRQSEECKGVLRQVYREWLQSGDIRRGRWAIDLMAGLNLKEALPLLEEALEQIKCGQSTFPEYFREFLEPAIAQLKSLPQV